MNRHAKASSAGSTQRQAAGLEQRLLLPVAILAALVVLTMGPATALGAGEPAVSSTTAAAVTTSSALLEAVINPQGQASTFHFEYGLEDCASNPCTNAPQVDGNVGSGSSATRVTHEVIGLEPGTIYHFRVVATNAGGAAEGPDRTFSTYEPNSPQTDCPNQAFRVGPSASLPDCRAYEMVSPLDKNGGGITTACNILCYRTALNQSSVDGSKMTFSSYKAFAGAISGGYSNQYLATRTAGGWSTRGISAEIPGSPAEFGNLELPFEGFLSDLSRAWVTDKSEFKQWDTESDEYTGLQVGKLSAAALEGFSSDGSRVFYSNELPLTPEVLPGTGRQIYEFSGGEIHLVSILPSGSPNTQASGVGFHNLGGDRMRQQLVGRAVSRDGSRVFWTDQTGPGNLYVRENPDQPQSAIDGGGKCTEPTNACTIHVGTSSSEHFWTATPDGSNVLYSVRGGGLFKFDLNTEVETLVAPSVVGVLGASDDLSYVYFVSREVLATGATEGQPNLYLNHDGTTTFVATLDDVDVGIGGGPNGPVSGYDDVSDLPLARPSRVTPDGLRIAFQSIASLTGYDNTDARNGEPDVEVFTYSAATGELVCASCNPSGVLPQGEPLQAYDRAADFPANNNGGPARRWTAAWLPTVELDLYMPHSLSDSGEYLFFNSFDALLPEDTNNRQDVYEWEAEGAGDCGRQAGCLSLVSTGDSIAKSEFADATPSGDSAFFETSAGIDPRDHGAIDIYVARTDGGFPLPAPPAPCEGSACQSAPQAPNDPTPSSSSYRGPGNAIAAKKKAHKKHRHKKRQRHSKRHIRPATRTNG